MYCSNCGAEVSGNFCSKCGAPVDSHSTTTRGVIQDWSEEVQYDKLIRIPQVRDIVSKYAAIVTKGLSGEECLAIFDKVVSLPVSVEKIATVAQPIFAQLGVKTGKERSETFGRPPGIVIVSVLCSLARHGQLMQKVQQLEDGCLFEAILPSDIWSFKGLIYVSVRMIASGTRVVGATKIRGQLFDWGKSRRCLSTLFTEIKTPEVSAAQRQ